MDNQNKIKMATKIYNLTYISGDDNSLVINFPDDKDVTDYEFYFTVKPESSTTIEHSDAILSVNTADCTFDTSTNSVTIPTNYSSNRIAEGVYKYDLQTKNKNTSAIATIMIGKYKIINDVTKRT